MSTANNQAPLLSITVLNYNYGHFLPQCLDSILSQNFKDFEVILINDKSTDNSLEIIEPYLRDSRIRLIDHEVNRGFVASLVEGAQLSRGKYITVISADDWIVDSSAIEKQVAVLEQDSNIVLAYTSYGTYVDKDTCVHIWRAAAASYVRDGLVVFQDTVLNPYILHSGTLIRKSAYNAIGGYDTSLRYAVDTKMWLGLCHVGKYAYIDEVLYAYRRHGNSMSKSVISIRKAIEEVLQALNWSFDLLPAPTRASLGRLKMKAEQKALIAYSADEVFSNRYREGWRSFWIALKIRPAQTLFQNATAILALRAVLGEQGFHRVEYIRAMFSARTRERLATGVTNSRVS